MTLHRGKLTARYVETAAPGTHDDGRGLRLLVRKGGSKCWILRYQLNKRRRDMGLGRYPETTLAMARDRALAIRREIDATRRDPLAERQRVKALTFKAAAEALIGSKESGWRNAKHAAQWPTTLQTYVYPKLGDLDVRSIDTRSVLEVLRPIWNEKPVTASRVRQRIEAVVDYATAMGSRAGDNPARWKGLLDNLLPKPSKVKQVEHLAALDWRHTPAFMIALAKRDGSAAKALAFAILTAARSGEVRGLTWAEIDDADAVWTIPANRTKAGKEHRVPLTAAARALLGARSEASKLVFGSLANPSRPLTDTALMHALRRMGRGDLTAHGFRSTFRDWAGETTAHPREVIEAALAHQLKDKAEAAYARGDLFVKRRKLMDDWAAFLAKPAGEVLPMTAERQVAAKG